MPNCGSHEVIDNNITCLECDPNWKGESCEIRIVTECPGREVIIRGENPFCSKPPPDNIENGFFDICEGFAISEDKFTCMCPEGWLGVLNDPKPSFCYDHSDFPHCLHEDIKHGENVSGFECIECEEEFFIFEGECFERQNNDDPNCLANRKDEDKCDVCKDDHVYDEEKESCIFYQEGIEFCETFKIVSDDEGDVLLCDECEIGYRDPD